jgi:hypothetical protein
MTRFVFDQFAKDYLKELLSPLADGDRGDSSVAGECTNALVEDVR